MYMLALQEVISTLLTTMGKAGRHRLNTIKQLGGP
jgi:hypothetical protein